MDDEVAINAILNPPQLERFRALCGVDAAIEPRFDGYTKHVLLTEDRAFLFPRNHTIVGQLERECDVYATVDHPLVPRLCGRWDEPAISPYPFFAVTRLAGSTSKGLASQLLPALASQLGSALAACHEIAVEDVPRRLWANPWSEPPEVPPTAVDCYSPIRGVGGADHVVDTAVSFLGIAASSALSEAVGATEAMAPVLAHGDIHDDHVLVDPSGALTGILDWGFGGVLSPLSDFTWVRELFAAEASYGEMRRHMWLAYAERRSVQLPTCEQILLAMAAFDLTALAPETATHYYWNHTPEWQAARRAAAGECLRALLASP